MKKATQATSGPKSNNCSLIGSKSNATLPPNLGYKIESNNGDDEGSKLVLGERNIATIFLPHEVVVVKKLVTCPGCRKGLWSHNSRHGKKDDKT
jgi:hypothetical protein